jgi:hypothetical protein
LSTFFQIYVSDTEKNEEYWAKRVKNNVAARRSREARRIKENQVFPGKRRTCVGCGRNAENGR